MGDAEEMSEQGNVHGSYPSGLHIMGEWGCEKDGLLSLTRALSGCFPGFMELPIRRLDSQLVKAVLPCTAGVPLTLEGQLEPQAGL